MQTGEKPRVAMIGLGYIGLPTAAIIAQSGCQVLGVDTSLHVIETLERGDLHIQEPDLNALVAEVVDSGMLSVSQQVDEADVFVIAVPTPTQGAEHIPDVSLVMAAADSIAPHLRAGNAVILESTSPVGTTEKLRDRLAALRPDLTFPDSAHSAQIVVAYCPERVLPGKILQELISNDRVVGGISAHCAEVARAFYEGFVHGSCITATAREAEMTKLVENSFRDVNIAFANELSMLADRSGIDVWNVIELANRHPRVNILQPGPGVGGHCVAVDPWFLVHSDPETARIARTAREVNLAKTDHVAARSRDILRTTSGPVAFLGLAFKPNIDDFRESPSLDIVRALALEHGPRMIVCEPYTSSLPDELSAAGVKLVSLETALNQSEAIILLVDHREFSEIEQGRLAGKRIYDTRGAWRYHDS